MLCPQKIRVADLFSGCGGLTEGVSRALRKAGRTMEVALAADLDQNAMSVYERNFNPVSDAVLCGSVETIFDVARGGRSLLSSERQLASRFGRIDAIVAGPPCQGHSSLNNISRGSDPRNLLYWAPIRAAMVFRPKVILIENVPGVAASQERVIDGARETLEGMHYYLSECTIKLSDLGVPQQRRRHVLLATSREFELSELLPERGEIGPMNVIDAISDLVDRAGPEKGPFERTTKLSKDNEVRINYLFDEDLYDLPNALRPACHRDKEHSYVSMYGRMHPDRPAQTITGGFGSMGQGRFVHPTRRRMITAHEAARIQGFHDGFDFTAAPDLSSLRKMIGNAAPPALSEFVFSGLIECGLI